MKRKCCPPAPAPFTPYPNCPQRFVRACSDGTGTITREIPGAYLFAETQEEADALALEIAMRRALNTVLICNILSPDDLADCGLVEERPSVTPGCTFLCDENGVPLCDENGDYFNIILTF